MGYRHIKKEEVISRTCNKGTAISLRRALHRAHAKTVIGIVALGRLWQSANKLERSHKVVLDVKRSHAHIASQHQRNPALLGIGNLPHRLYGVL